MNFVKNINEKFILNKSRDFSRKIEIEIGDTKQESFYPQMKIMHWENECNLSIRLKDNDYHLGMTKEIDDKIEWKKNQRIARFYDKGDDEFEFEMELLERPESNIIEFTIETKGLDFHYQPELTQEEIDNGAVRPDNVIGSYAVYHQTRMNNTHNGKKYETGKAFHIYRPWAEDAKKNRVWCDIEIDIKSKILTITVPQDFLDSAVYPVIVDPTFGITSRGASVLGWSANQLEGPSATAPENGSAVSIHAWIYSSSANRNFKGVLVLNSTKLIETNGISNAVTVDNDATNPETSLFSTPPNILGGTAYRLMIIVNSTNILGYYDSVSNANWQDASNSFTTPTNPTDGSTNSNRWSVYITYTSDTASIIKRRIFLIE